LIPKESNICYFGIKAIDALSTPWFVFVTRVIKHIGLVT